MKPANITAFLESFFTASNPYNQQGKEITASEILEDGAKRVDEELEDKPQVLIRIKNIIGNVYGKRGQSDLARNQYEESLKLFESHSIKDAKLNIITLVQLSEIEFFANDYTRMRDVLLMAKKIAEENLLYDKAEYLPLRFNLAAAYEELGEHDRAISMFDELLQIYLQDEKKFRTAIINTYNFVGLIKADAGNNEAAEQDLLKALSYLDKNVVTDSELETTLYHNLSTVYKDLKQYQKAIDSLFKVVDMRTKILGEQHPLLAITYDNISRNYRLLEEYDTARKYNDLAIKIFQDTKTINIDYGTVLGNKAMILIDAEQNYSDAEIYTLKAIDVLKQVFKERDHRFIANEITLLGKIYLLQGRNNKALEQTQEAINMYNRINYPTHLIATQAWLNLAEIYDKLNQKSKELETYHTLLQKLLQESRRDEEAIKEVTEKISFLSKE